MPGFQPLPALPPSMPGAGVLLNDVPEALPNEGAPETPAIDTDPATAPAQSPSSLRREILIRLRQAGPSSPDQLAAQLGASRTGVLQQLRALESAALVTRQTVRHGVGRPRHLYDVTADAQDLFPSNYDGLAAGLLAAVRTLGGEELIDELFAARRRQMGDRIRTRMAERLPAGASLAERVRELAVIQDEQGYLSEAITDGNGTVRLVEYNCAIYHVAKGSVAACRSELDLFSDVLGVQVVRESHIATGDRCCMYRVTESDRADKPSGVVAAGSPRTDAAPRPRPLRAPRPRARQAHDGEPARR